MSPSQRSFVFRSPQADSVESSHYITTKEHTPGHLNCPACAGALQMLVTPLSATQRFDEASAIFLASREAPNSGRRVRYLSPRTLKDMSYMFATLNKFFGRLRLNEIHVGHLASYQKARANGDGFLRTLGKGEKARTFESLAGAAKINYELGLLRRVMITACAWTPTHEGLYMPLQEPELEIPKALSYEEQDRFLAAAKQIPECEVIYWYALVALHTGFSSDELRTLRQGDINLHHGVLAVNRKHGKNFYRRREISITDGDCLYGLGRLIQRSVELVGAGENLYLFPKRVVRNQFDGRYPMGATGLRKQFEQVRDLAGVPWFNLNGFRHTAATNWAIEGMPEAFRIRRMGHTSAKMTEHYTHIEQGSERRMLNEMSKRKPVVNISAGRQQHHAMTG